MGISRLVVFTAVVTVTVFFSVAVWAGEADVVKQFCWGEVAHVLDDRTRVDCLTDRYAIEFDYPRKWAEAVGQSLHYALMTGKQPAIVLICNNDCDHAILRINAIAREFALPIDLFVANVGADGDGALRKVFVNER